jgi:polysaccharide export outer membrane protein
VFVFGQVQRPGTFKYQQGMKIVEVINLAGGFARLADQSGTYVTRSVNGNEQRILVSVPAIAEGREPNLTLEPGDIIYVPEAIF